MERRSFLKAVAGGVVTIGEAWFVPVSLNALDSGLIEGPTGSSPNLSSGHQLAAKRRYGQEYFQKLTRFNKPHPSDIHLSLSDRALVHSVVGRLGRLQVMIGHGNFQILGFDDALYFARRYSRVARFPRHEIDFLERIFYAEATRYGFYGEKVLPHLSDSIRKRDVVKIGGNYLLTGKAASEYRKIQYVIGDRLLLTSGVRGIIKQTYLFLAKVVRTRGNLSLASRSLAPPDYSYHAIGDFDVGEQGLGGRNFTSEFTKTEVFKQLVAFGYIEIRYPKNNLFGVRFEPWHIKIASKDAAPTHVSQNGNSTTPCLSFC